MTHTVVINVVLDLAVLFLIVGGMTWAILSDRSVRELSSRSPLARRREVQNQGVRSQQEPDSAADGRSSPETLPIPVLRPRTRSVASSLAAPAGHGVSRRREMSDLRPQA